MKRSYFKYIAALLLFGSNGIVANGISNSSYEIVLLRTIIGSLLLTAVFILKKEKLTFYKKKREAMFLVASGIAMGISWMFLYEAYQQIGVSIASLYYYCGPVIVMALSPILFKEKLTWSKIAGFFAVLCGIFLVNGHASAKGGSGWGLICGILSAVMYALMVISNKKAKGIPGMENAMVQLIVGFLTTALFVGIRQGYSIEIQRGEWIWIVILGVLNTGVGCYFYFSSIGNLSVQTVAVCGYLEPLSAVVFSVVFLNEAMTIVQIIGAVLILGGAFFNEIKKPDILKNA